MGTFYTASEVAKILKITRGCVYEKMRAGEFGDTVNIGSRCHRVTEAGLQSYIQAHTGPAYHPKDHGPKRQKAAPKRTAGRI